MKPELKESTKKPYETPKLSVYGDVREITQALAGASGNDMAGGTNHKTA